LERNAMSYIGNQPQYTSFLSDTFSGNGSTTVYTMAVAPANTAAVLVAIWGVLQDPTTYGVVGRTLTFSQAPPVGVGNISVRYLALPASNVTTTAYRSVSEFTATAGQTTFTPASYTPGFISVFRSGVRLGAANFTATNGVTVVLSNAAAAGDLITIESFFVSSVLNAIPNVPGSITPALLDSTSQSGSGALQIPTGTTAQRPTSPTVGMIRYNTTLNYIEEFRQSQWLAVSNIFSAVGGTFSTYSLSGVNYGVHTFTASDTFQVTAGTATIEYLIVAGGGGGGSEHGGGGGAGGMLTGSVTVAAGSYSIIIGGGGTGAPYSATNGAYLLGTNGANSSAFGLTAIGGGYGASYRNGATSQGNAGGSGGGGAPFDGGGPSAGGAGTAGQGNNGGRANYGGGGPYPGAGGGGRGAVGSDGTTGTGGAGGVGVANSLRTGSPIFYAGGGGGSAIGGVSVATPGGNGGGGGSGHASSFPGLPGGVNTGGGGGGSFDNAASNSIGGAGGSGIVVIRYIL
jgi:hypothetical protein